MKKIILERVKNTLKNKMKESLESFFKAEALKARLKSAVKGLIQLGAITRKGRLAPETAIEDILFGKYADGLAKAASVEVVNEGLLIQQTLTDFCEWAQLGSQGLGP